MYFELKAINQRPEPFSVYTAETLWNDPHISKQMLGFHMDESMDPASRNKEFMDRSLDWLVSRFNIGPHKRICDFGCGPGLYTTPIATTGAQVTGVDFSRRSIEYARKKAAQNNLKIDYVLGNYLEFETDKTFDLITMIYCDLCPLSPSQRITLLGKWYKFLDDDGLILLDVFSLSSFEKREEETLYEHNLMDGFWSASDYYGFLNTFKYEDHKVMLDKYTIVEANRTWVVYNWLQYYSLESIKHEFEENGFRIEEYYSDVAGTAYNPDSTEIAIVAKKAN